VSMSKWNKFNLPSRQRRGEFDVVGCHVKYRQTTRNLA
jgi:hypothetical protein